MRRGAKRWFEVGLVLLVACGSSVLNSLYLLVNGPGAMQRISSARWTIGIAQEIAALLLGYVLSRRGLSLTNLGFSSIIGYTDPWLVVPLGVISLRIRPRLRFHFLF